MAEMTDEMQPEAGADDAAGADEAAPQVLCTIMSNSDGSFTLVKGDEPEAAPADAGAPGAGMGLDAGTDDAGNVEAAGGAGEQFSEVGPLLKAVLDLLQAGGADNGDDQFQAGFTGGEPKSKMSAAAQRV